MVDPLPHATVCGGIIISRVKLK